MDNQLPEEVSTSPTEAQPNAASHHPNREEQFSEETLASLRELGDATATNSRPAFVRGMLHHP